MSEKAAKLPKGPNAVAKQIKREGLIPVREQSAGDLMRLLNRRKIAEQELAQVNERMAEIARGHGVTADTFAFRKLDDGSFVFDENVAEKNGHAEPSKKEGE